MLSIEASLSCAMQHMAIIQNNLGVSTLSVGERCREVYG